METVNVFLDQVSILPLWLTLTIGCLTFFLVVVIQILLKRDIHVMEPFLYGLLIPIWIPIFYNSYMEGFHGSILNGGAEMIFGFIVLFLSCIVTLMVSFVVFILFISLIFYGEICEPPFAEPPIKMRNLFLTVFFFMQSFSSFLFFGNTSILTVSLVGVVLAMFASIFVRKKKKIISMHAYLLSI